MTSRGVVIAPVMAPRKKSKPRVDGSDLSGRGNSSKSGQLDTEEAR
jgi:hypothetical protein